MEGFGPKNDATWEQWTWNAGFRYSARPETMFYGRLSKGERAGGFNGFGTFMMTLEGGRICIGGNTSGPHTEIDIRYIFGKQISLIGSTMGSHQDFRDVLQLIKTGRLKPVIDRVMPLSEGKDAYGLMERGEIFGKLVLTP